MSILREVESLAAFRSLALPSLGFDPNYPDLSLSQIFSALQIA